MGKVVLVVDGELLGRFSVAGVVIVTISAGREKLRRGRFRTKGCMCIVSCGQVRCPDASWECLVGGHGGEISMTRSERHTIYPLSLSGRLR